MFSSYGVLFFIILSGSIILLGFLLGLSRLLSCLIVLENLKVIALFVCLWGQREEFRILFLVLMVIFTIEVTLGLVVLSRIWRLRELSGFIGV